MDAGLNNVNLFKEVFLSYLNAAILEPILAIGGMETSNTTQIVINLLSLGSISFSRKSAANSIDNAIATSVLLCAPHSFLIHHLVKICSQHMY